MKKKPPAKDAGLLSSAQLCKLTGYKQPSISNMTSNGVISPAKRGLWDAVPTLAAMVRKLRERSEQAGSEDRVRKNKAEADNAELDTMERRKEFRAIAREMFADGFAQLKTRIESARYLKPEHKAQLYKDLHGIKLSDEEEG